MFVGGGALPAVRVDVNPTVLNSYGLGLEDVRTLLATANVNEPKGVLVGPTADLGARAPAISCSRPTDYRRWSSAIATAAR